MEAAGLTFFYSKPRANETVSGTFFVSDRNGSLALLRLWHRTQRFYRRISVCEHIRPPGRSRQRSYTLYRSVLLFAKKKQTSGPRYPWVIATVHSYCHASGVAHRAFDERITVIESISHRVVIPTVRLHWAAPSCCLRSCSLTVTNQQTSGRRYPWVTPMVLLFLERTISPRWG